VRAFVTGGTGFLGRYLVAELRASSWSVGVLARNAARAAQLPRGTDIIEGSLDDERALTEGARGADVVFHLAAATSGNWDAHAQATVAGTRRMLGICEASAVRRFVLASSIVVYDKRSLDVLAAIDESSSLLEPEPGAGAYARGKLEAEALAREHTAAGGRMEIVVARPGLIYAGDRLTFSHLGEHLGGTRLAYGPPSLPLPLVEVHSCVDALVRLATSEAAAGKTYHIVDSHCTTRAEYLDALAAHTGHRQRVAYLPVAPVAALAGAVAHLRPGKSGDLSADKIRARAVEVRYDTRALQRDTDWQPLSSVAEGLARHGVGKRRGPPRSIERVGLVGAGMIASIHIAALARIRGARLVGVLDTDHAAAQALAARVPGAKAYSDPQRFYAEAQPQIVHVLTPPRSHAAVALDALRNGAHVLLEKPAATSLHECDALLEAADALGLTIGVDETVAWDPRVRRARSALVHGVLGELVHVEVFMSYDMRRGKRPVAGMGPRWDRLLAGGPLEDLLPHPLSVVRALCGPLELRHFESLTTGRLGGDFPDELRASLGAGTATARVDISLSSRPDDFLVTLHGTRASARIDVQNMLLDLVTPLPGPRSASRGLRTLRSALRGFLQTTGNAAAVALGRAPPPASPIHLIAAHHAALACGEPPPAPLAQARTDIAIARAIWPEHKPAALAAVAAKPARADADSGAATARGERM
jgi:predicted dehydrogenase/nucleoside-diphosphate-sugar epimerase